MTDHLALGPRIGISGAIPSAEELAASGGSAQAITLGVRNICTALLDAGGNLVHGSHPTLVDLIKEIAEPTVRCGGPRRVHLFASRYFYTGAQEQDFCKKHATYALITMTGEPDMDRSPEGREPALAEMREVMTGACDALVCIGGRLHMNEAVPPGVEREYQLARARRIPVYLVGAGGGFTRQLFEGLQDDDNDTGPRNGLTQEENESLAQRADPWAAARLIVNDLRKLDLTRTVTPDAAPDVEHLKLIQDVVSRLAGNSFSMKGWSITLTSALLALAAKDANVHYALLALVPVLFFWGLDGYYLLLERRFRKIYDLVLTEAKLPVARRMIQPYVLNPQLVEAQVDPFRKVVWRPAVRWFHLPLLAVVLALVALITLGLVTPDSGTSKPAEVPAKAQIHSSD
jgi:hypothetical protein